MWAALKRRSISARGQLRLDLAGVGLAAQHFGIDAVQGCAPTPPATITSMQSRIRPQRCKLFGSRYEATATDDCSVDLALSGTAAETACTPLIDCLQKSYMVRAGGHAADIQFLAAALSGAGMVYALVAVPSPSAVMTVSCQLP